MRIVITGATGNVGTSVLDALSREPAVHEIIGVARRLPSTRYPRTRFETADVATDDLDALFRGADAVVHLAWQLQPSHLKSVLDETNVEGSGRVFEAAARAGVRALVVASSIGAYSAGPKDQFVDESWPTTGIRSSLYSRQKAQVEEMLDDVERSVGSMRIVRMRPALIFKREAASDVRRLFIGPLVPRFVFDRRLLRVMPDHPRLAFQCLHSLDVGEAFRAAIVRDVRGAFNLAADPVISSVKLAEIFHARRVWISKTMLRLMVSLTFHLHLQPSEPGWLDMAFELPLLDSSRAHAELGWTPKHGADVALLELVDGLREGAGIDTPPLEPRRGWAMARRPDPSWPFGHRARIEERAEA